MMWPYFTDSGIGHLVVTEGKMNSQKNPEEFKCRWVSVATSEFGNTD